MGILDDAIREHLELKRRAGADPGEIARLEREAFGAGEAAGGPPPPAGEETGVAVHEREPEHESAVAVEPFAPEPVLPQAPPERAPEPEPRREPESAPPPAAEDLDQPTRQFTAQELEEAEREHEPVPGPPPDASQPSEHDELEDTPDFLQETPEHDRLWFEQKPPKDFDF